MTIARLQPNPQKISDEFLEILEKRADEARKGEITSMLVIGHLRDGSMVMDHSIDNKSAALLIGLMETRKFELQMHLYEHGTPGEDIDEG